MANYVPYILCITFPAMQQCISYDATIRPPWIILFPYMNILVEG